MEIDPDPEVRPADLAGGGAARDRRLDLAEGVDEVQLLGRVHLDRRHPEGDLRGDLRGDVVRAVAADPGVDPHPVARRAAEELVDRDAERFPLDVPQRLLDPGEGAGEDRAAAVEAAAIENLEVVLDPERILGRSGSPIAP